MASQNIDPAYTPNSSKNVQEKAVSTSDTHSVAKRLQKELITIMSKGAPGVSAFPDGSNLFNWIGTVTGPADTVSTPICNPLETRYVYAGLTFKLSMEFTSSYPYSPPIVKFITPCYHPNVDMHGNICLDILKEKWSALYDVTTILISLQSLLGEPNNESPLNGDAASLWSNKEAYKKQLLFMYKADAKIPKN